MNATALDPDGYFRRGEQRIVPVGVNYWPASCGVELWTAWPEAEIQHDLDVIAKLGLNCIRFFLRWQDFEPEPGHYDEQRFARLDQLLEWCGQRRILAHPSLFVGFMSGGIFWPHWRQERNLFSDPFMVERSEAFAKKAAARIHLHSQSVLALDQGNELSCLPDSARARPGQVRHWCEVVNAAIRRVWPHALIVSGNEQGQLIGDRGWRFGQQPGTDFYSMHGYPVGAWHSVPFDGLTDPLAHSLLPFYTQVARAFGPVMVQEFGTILTFGREQQDRYLRAVLPACWEAGGNGFLWWCLRDISAKVHPYVKSGFEELLGLVDAADRLKPGVEFFLEFAREVQARAAPRPAANAVGLYFPEHYYPRDDPGNPGNHPRAVSRGLVAANFLLRQLGWTTRIVCGDQALPADLRTLVIPGAIPTGDEAERLEAWASAGGRLIWHGIEPMKWGHAYTRLLGARPVDFRAPRQATVDAFGERWTFGPHPHTVRLEVKPESARVLASDQFGLPALLVNAVGSGCVVYALPRVEEEFASCAGDRELRARWQKWYGGELGASAGL